MPVDIGWGYIFYNLLLIMVFTTIYFLVRESYRISGDKLSIKQILIIGIIIGIIAMLTEMFIPVWYPTGNSAQFITIIPLYIIIFTIMFDSRFAILMGFFALLGIFLRIPLHLGDVSLITGDPIVAFGIIKHSILEFINIISVIIIVIISQTFNLFKNINKQPKKIIYIFAIWMIIFEILIILVYGLVQTIHGEFVAKAIVSPFFFYLFYFVVIFIFQYVLVSLIETIYTNSDILKTFSTLDDVSYYKLSLSQQEIRKNIVTNNITMGLMILFYLDEVPEFRKEEILVDIRTQFTKFNKNAIFFKATSKSYATFIPMKLKFKSLNLVYQNNGLANRTGDDPLFIVDQIINQFNHLNYSIKSGISIYGIHSNNIVDLISKAEIILAESSRTNNQTKTIVYDYRRIHDNLINNAKIANLSNIISNRKDSFIPSINFKDYYYVLHYFKIKDKHFYLDQILKNLNHNDAIILQRFLAYQTLRSFKNKKFSKLILAYPADYLGNKDFDVENTIRRIAKQVPLNKVIMEFDSNLITCSPEVKDVLEKLRTSGIEFSISDAEKANPKNALFINPNYYMFSKMVDFKRALIEGVPDYKLDFSLTADEIK